MSRKRDTNWNRDEITALLDSIIEISRTRAAEGKRTNSRDVFDFAARKMLEKGHPARAERDKCRTKWKKMKEEYTQAKKAREGDTKYKEAPGIQPFYDRMEEFMNCNFESGSPKSTGARRGSNVSSSRSSLGSMRTSARIAANTSNATTSDNNDTSSTGNSKRRTSTDYTSNAHTSSNASPSSGQNSSRPSSGSINNNSDLPSSLSNHNSTSLPQHHNHNNSSPQQPNNQQTNSNGDLHTVYSSYNGTSNNINTNTSNASSASVMSCANEPMHSQPLDHADISYRVSTGCRQITIFGDHDVDIKFRGDCVTINKLDVDYSTADS